jgi:hypothetical protein
MHPEHPPSAKDDQRIYLDIATIRKTKKGLKDSKGNWQLMVHERTGLKFSDFFDKKSHMVEPPCEHFNRWKTHGKGMKSIHLDNAGENKLLEQLLSTSMARKPRNMNILGTQTRGVYGHSQDKRDSQGW